MCRGYSTQLRMIPWGAQKYLLVGPALLYIVCIRRSPVNWVDTTTLIIILGFLDNLTNITYASHGHKSCAEAIL